jgi:hypothetical protein
MLALVSAMIISSIPQPVFAAPADLSSFVTKYPVALGTLMQQCALCHTNSIPALNPYGAAYKAAGRSVAAFAAIENLDSDGDGFTNIQEINALTFPGDPSSHPALAATATNTALPPTATSVPPTATKIPPTATSVPPTATKIPPTATSVPPTATSVPPTATTIPPTATLIPPTATFMPPTATFVPPTAIPTNTSQPPTMTVPPSTGPFDLNIFFFTVTSEVELAEAKPIRIWLVVRNPGQVNGQATATVVGTENGVQFYSNTLTVTAPTSGAPMGYMFPSASGMVAGKIVWTLTLRDSTNVETRVRTTEVEGNTSHDDVNEHHYHRSDH